MPLVKPRNLQLFSTLIGSKLCIPVYLGRVPVTRLIKTFDILNAPSHVFFEVEDNIFIKVEL